MRVFDIFGRHSKSLARDGDFLTRAYFTSGAINEEVVVNLFTRPRRN